MLETRETTRSSFQTTVKRVGPFKMYRTSFFVRRRGVLEYFED